MSNAMQFFVQGARLGEAIQFPVSVGDTFTASDGTVWKQNTAKALAYSSTYASFLANCPQCVISATVIKGPYQASGIDGWLAWSNATAGIVGATAGGSTWLMAQRQLGNDLDYYYTSTDASQTWTQRTPPVAGKGWGTSWNGSIFLMYAASTTTNGAQTSADGIAWTANTAISIASIGDIIWNGSVWLVLPNNSTGCATSPDGLTWTSRTSTNTASASQNPNSIGIGNSTWNAGAGLFITGTNTAGQYQTSPDGATWTNRTPAPFSTMQAFTNVGSAKWASNSTRTVVCATYGMSAYSDNGTSWTVVAIDSTNQFNTGTAGPAALWWDGTRFTAVYSTSNVYYSTDGTSWTRATRGVLPTVNCRTPTGLAFLAQAQGYNLTDASSSSATNICVSNTSTTNNSSSVTYVRIL